MRFIRFIWLTGFALMFVLFLAAHVEAATITKPAATSGLIGWWPFDEGTSTSPGDFSTYRHSSGLVNGPVWASGKRGRAVDFDGLNDYVEVSYSSTLNYTGGDLTLSTWIYPDATETNGSYIVSKPWNGSGQYNYRLSYDSGRTISLCLHGNANSCVTTTATVARGEWSHIAATVSSGGTVTIYINGVSVTSAAHGLVSWTPSSGNASLPLCIGTLYPYGEGWGGNTAFGFDGRIDDARIYNQPLTALQISALYKAGETVRKVPDNNGLVGYWPMNEGTSTLAGDFSGNGITGTLATGVTWGAGKKGKASVFNGSTGKITTSSAVTVETNMTISAWIYKNASTGQKSFFSNRGASGGSTYLGLNGTSVFLYHTGGSPAGVTAGTVVIGRWQHVTATSDGSTLRFYINGELVNTASQTRTSTSGLAGIGWDPANATEFWDGMIDDVRVYSRVLGADEIRSLYKSNETLANAPQDTKLTSGLVGYWTFNGKDLSGSTVSDISGSANHGTLGGGAVSGIGKIGQALQFDGTEDRVDLPASVSTGGTANWTGSVWIKTTSSATQFIMTNQAGGPVTNALRVVSGVINYNHYDGAWQSESGVTAINDGSWHHLAWVNSSNQTLDMYVDGVLDANDVPSGTTNNGPLNRIGEYWGSGLGVIGSIDELRIYNRSLSAAEVKQLYLMGK